MSFLNINGVELELDLFDADELEKYERLNKELVEKVSDKSRYDGMSTPDAFREQCRCIDELFDGLFGAGTAKKVFNGKMNIKQHLEAQVMLANEAVNAKKELNAIRNKYSPKNREQRRFEDHKDGKKGKKRQSFTPVNK